MLAGAAMPERGRARRSTGRRGAILELGAGFHPEFTGRENIHLVGVAQGMSRAEIASRIDEIVDFSELGAFIDQPVRTYSSGMFLRLAFSIATAAEPDVLIVDEALAVGDQRFQLKCSERIGRFVQSGGTLVFCSHNLYQVKKLCRQALWIDHGTVQRQGPAAEVLRSLCGSRPRPRPERAHRHRPRESPSCGVERVEAVDAAGPPADPDRDRPAPSPSGSGSAGPPTATCCPAAPSDSSAAMVWSAMSPRRSSTRCDLQAVGADEFYVALHFPEMSLFGGSYHFNVATIDRRRPLIMLDVREGEAPFSVVNPKTDWGVCRLPHEWRHDAPRADRQAPVEAGRA